MPYDHFLSPSDEPFGRAMQQFWDAALSRYKDCVEAAEPRSRPTVDATEDLPPLSSGSNKSAEPD